MVNFITHTLVRWSALGETASVFRSHLPIYRLIFMRHILRLQVPSSIDYLYILTRCILTLTLKWISLNTVRTWLP